jgi:hypothetical protein
VCAEDDSTTRKSRKNRRPGRARLDIDEIFEQVIAEGLALMLLRQYEAKDGAAGRV